MAQSNEIGAKAATAAGKTATKAGLNLMVPGLGCTVSFADSMYNLSQGNYRRASWCAVSGALCLATLGGSDWVEAGMEMAEFAADVGDAVDAADAVDVKQDIETAFTVDAIAETQNVDEPKKEEHADFGFEDVKEFEPYTVGSMNDDIDGVEFVTDDRNEQKQDDQYSADDEGGNDQEISELEDDYDDESNDDEDKKKKKKKNRKRKKRKKSKINKFSMDMDMEVTAEFDDTSFEVMWECDMEIDIGAKWRKKNIPKITKPKMEMSLDMSVTVWDSGMEDGVSCHESNEPEFVQFDFLQVE